MSLLLDLRNDDEAEKIRQDQRGVNMVILVPPVQEMNIENENWEFNLPVSVYLNEVKNAELMKLVAPLSTSWSDYYMISNSEPAAVVFTSKKNLPAEGYELRISKEGALIEYSDTAGAFYGMMTLRQLMMQSPVRCCHITDQPGLSVRGFMLDISRGKVPTLQTLKETVDLLASLKYNHLELYIEGFSFAYPTFAEYWQEDSVITPEEIRELNEYCRLRCIELVPNQNSLGHMASWLAKPEFASLAELEGGMQIHGIQVPPTTLDSENPASLELVEKMMHELLPAFSSAYFNVNLDEPFELGKGKNSALTEAIGVDQLYLGYIKRLHQAVNAQGRRMMMWSDIVSNYPEMVREIPQDIIMLEWGYEAEHPFMKRAEVLSKAGLKFCLCPGTSSWTSISGITDNMIGNIRSAAQAAYKYGAEGMIMTDWGDMNHMQFWPISWPAIVLFSAAAWNGIRDGVDDGVVMSEDELALALNRLLFQDASEQMGGVALDAGRYCQYEEMLLGCRTLAVLPLWFGPLEGEQLEQYLQFLISFAESTVPIEVAESIRASVRSRKPLNLSAIDHWYEYLDLKLDNISLGCNDSQLVVAEYQLSIKLIKLLSHARICLAKVLKNKTIADELFIIADNYQDMWLKRNKKSGLEDALNKIRGLATALR
jgi:hypothetical protein